MENLPAVQDQGKRLLTDAVPMTMFALDYTARCDADWWLQVKDLDEEQVKEILCFSGAQELFSTAVLNL